jgi:hypothetical protein
MNCCKKAAKKTRRAKGKPPLPPREKHLDPKAASRTPLDRKLLVNDSGPKQGNKFVSND